MLGGGVLFAGQEGCPLSKLDAIMDRGYFQWRELFLCVSQIDEVENTSGGITILVDILAVHIEVRFQQVLAADVDLEGRYKRQADTVRLTARKLGIFAGKQGEHVGGGVPARLCLGCGKKLKRSLSNSSELYSTTKPMLYYFYIDPFY